MSWTNNHGLPEPLANAIIKAFGAYDKTGDISATGLGRPVQMAQLEKRHADEIVEDVADHIMPFIGTSLHDLIHKSMRDDDFGEVRMVENVNGWAVTGKPDYFDVSEGILWDYKITSVFSYLLGDKPEWERQMNVYAWLLKRRNYKVNALKIAAVLKDWSKYKAGIEKDWPEKPYKTIDIPIWTTKRAEEYIIERVKAHQDGEKKTSDLLPECSAEERWERKPTFAVKKDGMKKAVRVFESEEDAKDYVGKSSLTVEFRPGRSVRCDDYCPVKKFCAQYRRANGTFGA